jgi:hypothetical protein
MTPTGTSSSTSTPARGDRDATRPLSHYPGRRTANTSRAPPRPARAGAPTLVRRLPHRRPVALPRLLERDRGGTMLFAARRSPAPRLTPTATAEQVLLEMPALRRRELPDMYACGLSRAEVLADIECSAHMLRRELRRGRADIARDRCAASVGPSNHSRSPMTRAGLPPFTRYPAFAIIPSFRADGSGCLAVRMGHRYILARIATVSLRPRSASSNSHALRCVPV